MKNLLIISFLLIASICLQQMLPGWPIFNNLKPSIVLALLVHLAFRLSIRNTWQFTFISALIYDGLEPGSYGPALLSFPIITLLILKFRNDLFRNGLVTQIFCGAVSGAIVIFVTSLLYFITNARPISSIVSLIIFGAIIGAMIQPLLSQIIIKSGFISERGSLS